MIHEQWSFKLAKGLGKCRCGDFFVTKYYCNELIYIKQKYPV